MSGSAPPLWMAMRYRSIRPGRSGGCDHRRHVHDDVDVRGDDALAILDERVGPGKDRGSRSDRRDHVARRLAPDRDTVADRQVILVVEPDRRRQIALEQLPPGERLAPARVETDGEAFDLLALSRRLVGEAEILGRVRAGIVEVEIGLFLEQVEVARVDPFLVSRFAFDHVPVQFRSFTPRFHDLVVFPVLEAGEGPPEVTLHDGTPSHEDRLRTNVRSRRAAARRAQPA